MIAHALQIITKELNRHFEDVYSVSTHRIAVGNIALGIGTSPGNVADNRIILTLINYKEEKALKNLPNYVRNDITLKVTYENAPVYLSFMILLTATHSDYPSALLDLSRVIRFFQSQN